MRSHWLVKKKKKWILFLSLLKLYEKIHTPWPFEIAHGVAHLLRQFH